MLVGCAPVFAESGKAIIRGTTEGSKVSGTAMLTPTSAGLHIVVEVANVPPGKHGLHIHQYGGCGNQGNDAGGHYNPDGVKHGYLPTDGFAGSHAGDLGNIEVDADGVGRLTLTIPTLTLSGGQYSVGGRAIVLHDKVDDFGQPTGNAGGRIGCGTILITGE
jgi:Cu-Zn family superoxide dismutase